jgi:hypothetical protein
VLYATGYSKDAVIHQGRLDPDVELLMKPFTYELLAGKVRKMLDADQSNPARTRSPAA